MATRLEELDVWLLANELRRHLHGLTNRPPVKKDLRFIGQIHDCAGSVSRNIAEGYGHVRPGEFARFLFIARGSLFELRDHLTDGVSRGYWSEDELLELRRYSRRTTGALNGLIRYLRSDEARQNAAKWERRTKK